MVELEGEITKIYKLLLNDKTKEARKLAKKLQSTYGGSKTVEFLLRLIEYLECAVDYMKKPFEKQLNKCIKRLEPCLKLLKSEKEVFVNWDLLNLLIGSMEALNLYEETVEIIDGFLASNPNHRGAMVAKINALSALGRYEEAVELCREALKIFPDDVEILSKMAHAMTGAARVKEDEEARELIEEAKRIAREVLKRDRRNCTAYYAIAIAYAISGDLDEGIRILDEALSIKDCAKNNDLLLLKGDLLRDTGRLNEALKIYEYLMRGNPTNPDLWTSLKKLWTILGDYKKALECAKRAYELNRNDTYIIEVYVDALRNASLHTEALKVLDEAIKRKPADPALWLQKGLTLSSLDRFKDAEKCFRRVIELNPPKSDTSMWASLWTGLGRIRYYMGNYVEAIKYFDKALEILPNFNSALFLKARALFRLGRYHEALEYYELLYKVIPYFGAKEDLKREIERVRGYIRG